MQMKYRLFVVVLAWAQVDLHTKLAFEAVEDRKIVTAEVGTLRPVVDCWVSAEEH